MPKKNAKKPKVKIEDLRATKNPKGGATLKTGSDHIVHKHIAGVKYE